MPVRMIAAVQVALIFLSPNSSMTQTIPAHGCVSYEPSHVTLQGTLVRKTFPGPPNYESVKNGDKPQTSWILELQENICVDEDKAQPDLNPISTRSRVGSGKFNWCCHPSSLRHINTLSEGGLLRPAPCLGESRRTITRQFS
jgi:hypothetical protein